MGLRNDLDFRTHEQVGSWYDQKYTEMGGGWLTPTHELDFHLRALVEAQDVTAAVRNTRLVDFGCGDGQFLYWASSYPFQKLVGIDISDVAVRLARERCNDPNVSVVQTTMEDPIGEDFEPGSFDWAISLGSLEHCLDIPAAVRSMWRLLTRGGRFLIYVPNEEWIHADQPLETTLTGDEWTQILTHAGLRVESVVKMNDNNRITGRK